MCFRVLSFQVPGYTVEEYRFDFLQLLTTLKGACDLADVSRQLKVGRRDGVWIEHASPGVTAGVRAREARAEARGCPARDQGGGDRRERGKESWSTRTPARTRMCSPSCAGFFLTCPCYCRR